MRILGVIPSRYASTRFPGKPLAEIAGKSMVQRVFEQCRKATALSDVLVATDDQRIFEHVEGFGGKAAMTSPSHPTGTDRIIEIAAQFPGFDAYVNIQGDEPFIAPESIDAVCAALEGSEAVKISTLIRKFDDLARIYDPNTIKVAMATTGRALYFSRSPLPFFRGEMDAQAQNITPAMQEYHKNHGFWQHIGIYGYTAAALQLIHTLPKGLLEGAESLEQLRWLEHGIPIYAGVTDAPSMGVDTPEDLARIAALRAGRV